MPKQRRIFHTILNELLRIEFRLVNNHCMLWAGQIFFLEKVASEEGDESFPKRILLRNYWSGLVHQNRMTKRIEFTKKTVFALKKNQVF